MKTSGCVVLTVGMLAGLVASAGAQLLQDGGFEDFPVGTYEEPGSFGAWTHESVVAIDDEVAHSGAKSLSLLPGAFIYQEISTTPGAEYELKLWNAYFGGEPAGGISVLVTLDKAGVVAVLPTGTNEWAGHVFRFMATNSTTRVGLGSLSTVQLDDVEVVPLPAATFQFSMENYTVEEGTLRATIFVNRTGAGQGMMSVDFLTEAGSAVSGQDYMTASGRLIFAAGQTARSFDIIIINDTQLEPDETLSIVLTNATGGAGFPDGAASTSATLTIMDNDVAAGQFSFSAINYSVNEGSPFATITVNRTGGSQGLVSVQYRTLAGNAGEGVDFEAANGTLTFASGQTSRSFNVAILNDTLVEPLEILALVLTNATGGAVLSGGVPILAASLTIVDDDSSSAMPHITGIERDGDVVKFRFSGEPPYDYFVEYKDAPTPGNWLTLTNYRAKLQSIEPVVTDSISNAPTRFYRIRREDCLCD